MRGRPFGFLALVATGWIGLRAVLLWPDAGAPVLAQNEREPRHESFPPFEPRPRLQVALNATPSFTPVPPRRGAGRPTEHDGRLSDAQILALYGLRYFVEERPPRPAPSVARAPADAVGAAVGSSLPTPSRWSVAAWLSVREGRADPRLTPLLGASQAGMRISYAVSTDRRIAVFARAAAPLARGPGEVAAGVQWRPGAAPVTGFFEARHRAGAGIAPAAGAFGGGSINLPADFRLDGYGQAGWVGGRDATGFVEGQARATRIVGRIDGAGVELGAGVWGAAQRGAARLDVGPAAGVVLPLGRGAVRLGLDWRQRIAGRAAPGSGAVLTLGAGF